MLHNFVSNSTESVFFKQFSITYKFELEQYMT